MHGALYTLQIIYGTHYGSAIVSTAPNSRDFLSLYVRRRLAIKYQLFRLLSMQSIIETSK